MSSLLVTLLCIYARFGKEGVTEDEIVAACKAANAYGFIQKLPNRLKTLVGK